MSEPIDELPILQDVTARKRTLDESTTIDLQQKNVKRQNYCGDGLRSGPGNGPGNGHEHGYSRARRLHAIQWILLSVALLFGTASQALAINLLGGDEPLSPEVAFVPTVTAVSDQAIEINWAISDGYYLYRDKMGFAVEAIEPAQGSVALSAPVFAEAEIVEDDFFGEQAIFRYQTVVNLPYSQQQADNLTLAVTFQGCADIGLCYPPTTVSVLAAIPASLSTQSGSSIQSGMDNQASDTGMASSALSPVPPSAAVTNTNLTQSVPQSEQARLSGLLAGSGLWVTIATFFGLGLLLAFTPCVLPMIPILSSLIVGQGNNQGGDQGKPVSSSRAFQLSLVYVLVMASTYAAVGIIVGLSGYNVQAFLQNPWVLSFIALLFVALALAMFGAYELQMPAAVQNRLTQWSNRQGGGQFGGVAAMGFISTLIVGPCITAPLAGALLYIANTGDALTGGTALFALGLGMGAPLLLIGTSAGSLVPKAGPWMNTVRDVFGIVLLGMALYMLSRFLPAPLIMGLYGALIIISMAYLGLFRLFRHTDPSHMQRLGQGVGLAACVYGVALMFGALSGGGGSYTTPLRALTQTGSLAGDHADLRFERIKTTDQLQQVVAQARTQNRPVMLDFYADWCVSCKEMEAFTFSDPQVQDLLANAVLIQADVTANDTADQALLKQFELFGPPGIIFWDQSGQELPAARIVGFMNAERFADHIRRFIGSGQSI